MREGGRLFLRVRRATDPASQRPGVRLTIADSGHGMDPQTLRNIFEPFFTTKGITGTGLGLWISRTIIEKHQGLITCRSTNSAHRHGTVFSLFLPHKFTE
jgi:signal transduction histidine kinase